MSSKLLFQRRTSSGLADIGEYFAAYEKRNLLDNADFRNPVNQRGETSYSASRKYTIDRWALYTGSGGSIIKNSGSITLAAGASGNAYLIQPILLTGLAGKKVTLSAQVLSGSGRIGVFANSDIFSITNQTTKTVSGQGIHSVTATVAQDASGYLCVYMACSANETLTVERVMLEYGEESTLAQAAPAKYGAELAECRRYAIVISAPSRFRMTNYASGYLDFNIPLSTPLRGAPSLESGEFAVRSLAMSVISGLVISNVSFITYRHTLGVRVTAEAPHGLTDAVLYVPSKVIISADV